VIEQAIQTRIEAELPLRKTASTARTRAVAAPLIGSRLLVFVVGSLAVAIAGFGPPRKVFEHAQLTRGFGSVGNVLLAGSARWDAAWYLLIARAGYAPSLGSATVARSAFFPLYPLLIRLLSFGGGETVRAVAGVTISLAALAVAAVLLFALARAELIATAGFSPRRAERAAALAVAFLCLAPVSFFFSAIYPESLFLALSLAVFWFARQGRFLPASLLAALAAATRPTGAALAVPLLAFYVYGPRTDRLPDRPAKLRPRYRPTPQLAWLALVPVGLAAFSIYLWAAGGSPTAPFSAESLWGRTFEGPFSALVLGAGSAASGLGALLGGGSTASQVAASHNVELFIFAVLALIASWQVIRLLPLPYGAYLLAALILPLSYPAAGEPLMSLPRFLLVLFPFYIWLGGWLVDRPRLKVALLSLSAAALILFTASFATWHWVS